MAVARQREGDLLRASVHVALIGQPRLRRDEPAVRRLFIADRLMTASVTPDIILQALGLDPAPLLDFARGYNPDQPRVPAGSGPTSGRWTAEDGGEEAGATEVSPKPPDGAPAVAAAVAATAEPTGGALAEAGSFFAENVAPRALAALAQLAIRAAGPVALFGMLVVPSSRSPIVEGEVPGRSDLRYVWNQDEGNLLVRRLIDGQWVTLTQGPADPQEVFHDVNGKPFARVSNHVLIVDIAAMSQAEEDDKDKAATGAAAAAAAAKSEPKLCPDPIPESNEGWSKNSVEYQLGVSGLPPSLAVKFYGVKFDGCVEEEGGLLLQATGARGNFLTSDGEWVPWFQGEPGLAKQIDSSFIAAMAGDRDVEWHVQDRNLAAWMENYVGEHNYSNIEIIYDPIGVRLK
jgi:hypothetical protein